MTRTVLITGTASGIGQAAKELFESRGDTVIGADIRDADITADLSTADGRRQLAEQAAELSGGSLDAVLAVAGMITPSATTVAVNYYGAIGTLEGVRPLLERSAAPRAVLVSSMASIQEAACDAQLLELLLESDPSDAAAEERALARAAELAADEATGYFTYATSKRALSRWLRRTAPSERWAGAGIALNAVAPAVTLTAMTAELVATPEARAQLNAQVPMPLNGPAEPAVIAEAMAWLASPANTHCCGQVLFVDGGYDAVTRGDATW